MRPARTIVAFFVRLVLFYALLVSPWPGWRACYGVGYRAVANKLFRQFGADGAVRFRAIAQGREKADTEIDIANRRTSTSQTAQHSTIVTGYLPTAAVVALILATPLPWVRRIWALLGGLTLVNLLVVLRLFVVLLYGFSGDDAVALFWPGAFWRAALTMLFNVVAMGISFTFVAPLFIWVIVAVRRRDLERVGLLVRLPQSMSHSPRRAE